MFDSNKNKARKLYEKFVQDDDSDAVVDFYGKKKLGSFFGGEDFIKWDKGNCQHLETPKEVTQSRYLAPTIPEIKVAVSHHYKIDLDTLERSKRGQVNEPRNIAVYIAQKRSGLTLEHISQEFGIAKYSSVSSIVTRFEKQLADNKQLNKIVEKILKVVVKSQAKICPLYM